MPFSSELPSFLAECSSSFPSLHQCVLHHLSHLAARLPSIRWLSRRGSRDHLHAVHRRSRRRQIAPVVQSTSSRHRPKVLETLGQRHDERRPPGCTRRRSHPSPVGHSTLVLQYPHIHLLESTMAWQTLVLTHRIHFSPTAKTIEVHRVSQNKSKSTPLAKTRDTFLMRSVCCHSFEPAHAVLIRQWNETKRDGTRTSQSCHFVFEDREYTDYDRLYSNLRSRPIDFHYGHRYRPASIFSFPLKRAREWPWPSLELISLLVYFNCVEKRLGHARDYIYCGLSPQEHHLHEHSIRFSSTMEKIADAYKAGVEKVKETVSGSSKEAHKEVAKDSSNSIGTRVGAAMDAAGQCSLPSSRTSPRTDALLFF